MRRSEKSQVIRQMLRERPMTTSEISSLTGLDQGGLPQTLRAMPDAYIKEWGETDRPGRRPAIWAVVVPPPNARQPKK